MYIQEIYYVCACFLWLYSWYVAKYISRCLCVFLYM